MIQPENETMATTKRANKGGEVAPNGEFYKGGRFINTIAENPKKNGSQKKTAKKVQVEPWAWEMSREGQFPIFSIVGAQASYIDRNDAGKGIQPHAGGVEYYGDTFRGHNVADLCNAYNSGTRWMEVR
jgi:hypothetical protein